MCRHKGEEAVSLPEPGIQRQGSSCVHPQGRGAHFTWPFLCALGMELNTLQSEPSLPPFPLLSLTTPTPSLTTPTPSLATPTASYHRKPQLLS